MKARHGCYLLAAGLVMLAFAAGCAPAAVPTSAPAQVEGTHASMGTALPEATSAPAAPAATSTQMHLATATANEAASTYPTAAATVQAIPAGPVIEKRVVELEWPAGMKLGESDVIRLTLNPDREGYLVTAEFPEHATQSAPLRVQRTPGYTLYGVARLDGVGFNVAPAGNQEYSLPENEAVTWRWSLSPKTTGQQRISISLVLRWEPEPGINGPVRESLAFTRGLNIPVTSFFGLTRSQAGTAGFFSLIAGGLCCLFGLSWRGIRPRRSAGMEMGRPNAALLIEPAAGIALTGEDTHLLQALFERYSRLALESEYLSGYSGSRTFLARPILADGSSDARTIIKIGSRQAVRREYDNYEEYVKNRLPPITARIQRAPVSVSGSGQAALQYTFLSEPGKSPVSLRSALLRDPNPGLITRLFDTFGPQWWLQRSPYAFRMEQEYDRLLPPHAVLEPVEESTASTRSLGPETGPGELDLRVGDVVRLERFPSEELRADGRSLNLTGFVADNRPPLRVRLAGVKQVDGLTVRVTDTRATLLRKLTAGMDLHGLPDPLEKMEDVLQTTVNGSRSVIHGDLNLDNILVGPGELVWLIDFAETGMGHPMQDFAHLYSQITAHILAPRGYEALEFIRLISSDGEPLLTETARVARRCQLDSERDEEFRLASGLTCLGALKFPNLTPAAKYSLYLTAAVLFNFQ
jgi:hypothetical protein